MEACWLINFAVSRGVLGADAIAGCFRVMRRFIQSGTFDQIVNIAVVGTVVKDSVPQLRRGEALQEKKREKWIINKIQNKPDKWMNRQIRESIAKKLGRFKFLGKLNDYILLFRILGHRFKQKNQSIYLVCYNFRYSVLSAYRFRKWHFHRSRELKVTS